MFETGRSICTRLADQLTCPLRHPGQSPLALRLVCRYPRTDAFIWNRPQTRPIPRNIKVEVVVPSLETVKAYQNLFKSPKSKRSKLESKVEPLLDDIKFEPGKMSSSNQDNQFTYKVRELYKTTDAQDIKVAIDGLHNVRREVNASPPWC